MSIEEIANQFALDLIVMFGSRARDQSTSTSDTDIAVRSSRELSRDDELQIATALDKLYPNVDLCDIRKASPLLLGAIGQDAKLIYQRHESLLEEFKIFAWNQYMDFKPQLDLVRERNKAEIDAFDEESE
jgi:predicted nucleotidyltransferase